MDGMRPRNRNEPAAQAIRPRRGGRDPLSAHLYRVEEAVAKRPATPAQLAAVARATRARQELAMLRHGVDPHPEPPEIEHDHDREPAWEWDGFER
ncbi:hypothetical protein [Nocardia sp. NBC_00403]|uniref:hypothetical protein n=1 Tax=Nocardia sp. NBC_00403 TaxID=2975990 RepID=UPI003FA554B0